jgi:hypothetical protein
MSTTAICAPRCGRRRARRSRCANGKFVAVVAKQPDGSWAFVSDGDSDTPAASFDNARPVAGLKFDS